MKKMLLCVCAVLTICYALFSAPIPAASAETAADRDPAGAETGTVTAEGSRNITGTYRKYDSGDTPVILFLDGTGARSRDSALLRYEELIPYNLYCFNTTSPDGKSFNIANYRTAEELQCRYADAVIAEVLRVFPDATEIGVVTYSNGGYGAGAICRAADGKGLRVCWAAGYDNVVRKEKRYLTLPDFIRETGVPSLLAVSTDSGRQITRNTAEEMTLHGSDYTVTKTYDSGHDGLLYAEGVSRDLADFAAQYFDSAASGQPDSSGQL